MSKKTIFVYVILFWVLLLFLGGVVESYFVIKKLYYFMKANLIFLVLCLVALNTIIVTYLTYQMHVGKKKIAVILQKFGIKAVLLLCLFSFMQCSTPRSYQFAKYAVHTGLDIAEEAGTFKQRSFVLPTKWQGDTLIFYKGINTYLLLKKDSTYILTFTPNRQNIQDTCLHFLRKKLQK